MNNLPSNRLIRLQEWHHRNLPHWNRQARHRHRPDPRMPKGDGAFHYFTSDLCYDSKSNRVFEAGAYWVRCRGTNAWCSTMSYPMSAYDIRIYGHRARYNRIRCRVRCLELHDLDSWFQLYSTRYSTQYSTWCNSILVYTDIGPNIVFHVIVYYTILCFMPSCFTWYRVSRHHVLHNIVFHAIVQSSQSQTDSENAPEGSSKHCLLAKPSLKALHFAKSGGVVYNEHVRAQPMACLKRWRLEN